MSPRVLFLLSVWPEPTSTATGIRSRDLVALWRSQGWEVICSSPAEKNTFAASLESLGAQTIVWPANDSRFDSWISDLAPDFAVFDRFYIEEQFGWRVDAYSPSTIRVLDTQDLHFLRRARDRALAEGADPEVIAQAHLPFFGKSTDTERELSSILRSDLTLICSDFEEQLLVGRFGVPRELLVRAPLLHPEPWPGPSFEDRLGFCAIGNLRHPPNADAVRWLSRELWPTIRARLPQATLDIWGAYIPKEIQELQNPTLGLWVRGHAANQYQTLSGYRVNLAPVRTGAGIKGKIADGWLVGTPCVTTPIGAEGMWGSEPFAGEVASTATAFAERASLLHEDKSHWQLRSDAGQNAIREIFSLATVGPRVLKAFQQAHDERDARREQNLVGRLLRHGLHRGTEYFSRWIEVKTQLKGIGPAEIQQ